MAFNTNDTTFKTEPVTGTTGEALGKNIISTYTNFEDGLIAGNGVIWEDGTITNGVAGIFAGFLKRDVTGAVEDGGAFNNNNAITVDVIEQGLVNVTVKTGITPTKFARVFVVWNNNGLQATIGEGTEIDAYYYEQVATGVWTIVLNSVGKMIA